ADLLTRLNVHHLDPGAERDREPPFGVEGQPGVAATPLKHLAAGGHVPNAKAAAVVFGGGRQPPAVAAEGDEPDLAILLEEADVGPDRPLELVVFPPPRRTLAALAVDLAEEELDLARFPLVPGPVGEVEPGEVQVPPGVVRLADRLCQVLLRLASLVVG